MFLFSDVPIIWDCFIYRCDFLFLLAQHFCVNHLHCVRQYLRVLENLGMILLHYLLRYFTSWPCISSILHPAVMGFLSKVCPFIILPGVVDLGLYLSSGVRFWVAKITAAVFQSSFVQPLLGFPDISHCFYLLVVHTVQGFVLVWYFLFFPLFCNRVMLLEVFTCHDLKPFSL